MYSGQQKSPSTLTPPVPPPPDASPLNGASTPCVSARAAPVLTSAPVEGFFVVDLSIGFSTGLIGGTGFASGVGATISGAFVAGAVTTGFGSSDRCWIT